ncbi:MAG: DUF2764 family protein [Candidatus Omnitrophota bacterium]
MGAYYTYLISSLPILNFLVKPAFSLEEFFTKCQALIPETEIKLMRNVCYQEAYLLDQALNNTLGKWANFEIDLRNELAVARAHRKKIDPLKFLRITNLSEAQVAHVAMAAYRSASILEAEKILDSARWNFLEFLSLGHYFDFDFLLIYALKLKILERWDKIQKADKETLFNQVILN